ncbi:hypothetical protein BC829DRAFT_420768 [Chytridium lagenaria]|nr:hypothetical protein BC829DRAFT_420768 [Chytridium lagenaria]
MYISTLILVLVLVISTQADLQRRQGGYPNPSHRSAPLNGPGRRNACGGGALRREWRELSPGERSEFLNAVKCLQRTPSILTNNRGRSGSVYDDFAYTHLFNTPTIHQVAQFLPWHRTYLVFFENALKDFCGFSGSIPYWDWTLDSQAPEQSDVWRTDAFGGTGGEEAGNPATCVTRNFDRGSGMRGSVYSPEQIGALLATRAGGFNRFRVGVNVPHAAVHNAIGGDMSNPGPSPNDPIFIVHHAMIDKIWADWQELYPDVGDVFEGNRDEGNPGANDARDSDPISGGTDLSSRSVFPGGLTARNAMWTTGGGWFCYRYSRPPVVRRMVAAPVKHYDLCFDSTTR